MSAIAKSEKDVVARKRYIVNMIAPLVMHRNNIEAKNVSGPHYTIAVLARGQNQQSVSSPDHVKVQTRLPGIYFNYYEIWVASSQDVLLRLDRAYLHIYRKLTSRSPDRQILCLHCDPSLKNSDVSYIYKKGPHLHLIGSEPSIDRAHISLCLDRHSEVTEDLASLMQIMSSAIMMISKEIFSNYERSTVE